jgi:hypothetical protein
MYSPVYAGARVQVGPEGADARSSDAAPKPNARSSDAVDSITSKIDALLVSAKAGRRRSSTHRDEAKNEPGSGRRSDRSDTDSPRASAAVDEALLSVAQRFTSPLAALDAAGGVPVPEVNAPPSTTVPAFISTPVRDAKVAALLDPTAVDHPRFGDPPLAATATAAAAASEEEEVPVAESPQQLPRASAAAMIGEEDTEAGVLLAAGADGGVVAVRTMGASYAVQVRRARDG